MGFWKHAQERQTRCQSGGSQQLFFNQPLLLLEDSRHSESESRFHALVKTAEDVRFTSPSRSARLAN